MSKERLEEITDFFDRLKASFGFNEKDVKNMDWLIEQAERAQNLEGLCEQLIGEEWMNDEGLYESEIMKLEKQNKTYREARKEIESLWDRTYEINANEYIGGRLDGLDIAMNIIDEALERESNG